MPTTFELTEVPQRNPRELSYADLTGGVEPAFIVEYRNGWLFHFAEDLTDDQINNVRGRAQTDSTMDANRNEVLAAAPNIQLILNSTGTLTAAQLSDAVRALARAVWALGKLVLRVRDER